jgi:DNA-binding NarL/FixJ family response regulator
MSFADAIVYALEEKPSARTRQSSVRESLTRRELEIAALVAEGLSNKQIAARLVIGQRTAETHIENIMNKLGVSTRAQVAAWAVAQDVGASR